MKSCQQISYTKYESFEEMPQSDHELVDRARNAAATSHSPHSNFSVGAAVRLSNGEIISAANVESEVYPQGMCAERSLLYFVATNFADYIIEAIAISSITSDEECYPCGACRQTLLDTEHRQVSPIRIIMAGSHSATVVESATLLLPFAFKLT